MPANDFDSEALLSFVSELTRRVEDLKKEIVSLGDQSGTGMRKTSEQMEKLGQQIDKSAKPLKAMKDQSSNLVSTLRGSVGLGVAFYSASQAMENFVRGELQLRNFAIDVGLTSSEVSKMRTQLSAAGIDARTADQQLGSLASKLDSIKTYQTASPVYKAVAANDPILAKQLLDAEKVGDRMKSIDAIRQKWNVPGERSKLYLGETLGVTASTMQALNRNQTGLVQPWEYSQKELDKYNREWTNTITTVTNIWGASMMTMVSSTNEFVTNTEKEWGGISTWFQGLKADYEGKGKPGQQMFGPKGVLPNKQEIESLFGPKGILPDSKELGEIWENLKKQLSTEAHADEPTGSETLLEGDASFSQRFGEWGKDKLDIQKNSGQLLQDIRDLLQNESGSGGPMGVGGAGYGSSGDGADSSPGSPGGQAKLTDEAGNAIDQETMKQAEALGRSGDVKGLQQLFAKRGYRMSGAACGIVASKYARAAGFQPPKAGAIATTWHTFGEPMKPGDINAPEHPFGSMFATYYHRRYGGNPNEVLKPGQIGGHVMAVVPGTYDEKTGTIDTVDQYGYSHGRRNIKDLDLRFAGAEAVKQAAARREGRPVDQNENRAEARDKIDSSFPGMRTGTAGVNVEFNGVPKGVKTEAELLEQGVFKRLNIKKSQQTTYAQDN
jgi:hypothetical protein